MLQMLSDKSLRCHCIVIFSCHCYIQLIKALYCIFRDSLKYVTDVWVVDGNGGVEESI